MQGENPCLQTENRPDTIERRPARLPFVVYVLALGTFLMLTTEFVVAGILPQIAGDLQVPVAEAGLLITVFAAGMVGAPLMAMLTRRLPRRLTLILALVVFAAGHVVVALGSTTGVLLPARFLTALATGSFWAVAAVVATRAAGEGASSRALGIVNAGGMLATVIGVPLGAFAAQVTSWRGTFWALAILAVGAMALIARHVPRDGAAHRPVSIGSELTVLRSGRLWLALAACSTTTGGVLAAYSYIAPLLTDQAGMPSGLVPLVLAGFGVGSLAGSLVGGRLGDSHPHATTILAPGATAIILAGICFAADAPIPLTALIVLLGLVGLGANPVLVALAVRYAEHAPTLGSALAVAAFNAGTAAASWIGGIALASGLGATGPVAVGTAVATLTLIPTIVLALLHRRATATAAEPVAAAAAAA
ncbi:MFS transporter [Arthrobacter sp. USHLN218]|uniref:MFS transporter n=1 Tax=Arthrobacter sp. USHLN218 TaxID=3081232 RepID=UPI0030171B9F